MTDFKIYNSEPLIPHLHLTPATPSIKKEQNDNSPIPGENLINKARHLITICFVYWLNLVKMAYYLWFNLACYLISFVYQREKSIYNKIVLITGSGGYLGRHLALELAKRNALLVLWDCNEEENNITNELLKSKGYRRARLYTLDITDHEELKETANKVKSQIGDPSMIIMAAAPTVVPKSILDTTTDADISIHYKISYLSQLWLIQEFLTPMINKQSGHFVTISSSTALVDIPFLSSYASFKLAQTKLIESLREELNYNNVQTVKTTIVYLAILDGGLVNGLTESFEFPKSLTLTGKYAAEQIVSGILRNKCLIFLPYSQRFYSIIKDLVSPRLLAFFVAKQLTVNPKLIKLNRSLF
jgi:all-trans-retinol dehydrogenase (NAD+)